MENMYVVVNSEFLQSTRDGNYMDGIVYNTYEKAETQAKKATSKKGTDFIVLQPIAQAKAVVPAIEVVKLNTTA